MVCFLAQFGFAELKRRQTGRERCSRLDYYFFFLYLEFGLFSIFYCLFLRLELGPTRDNWSRSSRLNQRCIFLKMAQKERKWLRGNVSKRMLFTLESHLDLEDVLRIFSILSFFWYINSWSGFSLEFMIFGLVSVSTLSNVLVSVAASVQCAWQKKVYEGKKETLYRV